MDHIPSPDLKLKKQRAFIIHFVYWFIIIAGGFFFAKYLLPVFLPFVLAYLIAWTLNRPICWLTRKTHLPRGVSAVLLILLFTMGASGILTLVGTALVSGIRAGAAMLPQLFSEGVLPALEYFFSSLEQLAATIDPAAGNLFSHNMDSIYQVMTEGVVQACGAVLGSMGELLTHVPSGLMKTLITLIASIFIAIDFDHVRSFLIRLVPAGAKPVLHESGSFFGRVVPRCLLSYLMIFTVTFAELLTGLLVLGISNAPIIALVVALLDILPVLGTGTILLPWSLFSLLRGRPGTAIGLLVLYVIITIIRNMLEPRLVGKQIQLHPVLTFMGMLVGVRFFGFFGLFGVPLLLAFLRHLHEHGILHIPVLEHDEHAL